MFFLSGIDEVEKPLYSRLHNHSFRDEDKYRHISPQKFKVSLKYLTPAERLAKAQADVSMLLSA